MGVIKEELTMDITKLLSFPVGNLKSGERLITRKEIKDFKEN